MSTLETGMEAVSTVPESGGRRVRTRLVATATCHAIVDYFASVVIPLLSVLEGRLHLTPAQGALLVAAGSVSSGAIQPVVAWLSDRFDTRWLGTIGMVATATCIGLIGRTTTFEQLLVLQVIGAAGNGAFHPVAAAAMGQLSGARRSIGMSVFFASGMVGSIAGSLTIPRIARGFGTEAIAWTIAPGLLGCAVLAWAIHSVAHRHAGAHERHGSLSAGERRARWGGVAILYVGNVLRFSVNMALAQLVVRWSEGVAMARVGASELTDALRTEASTINGPMHAAMAFGMGLGGLSSGFLIKRRHEKASLVLVPCIGAISLALIPLAPMWGAFGLTAAAGASFAGVIPITLAWSQRLLPHRTGLASSLMMGGAWMFACVAPPLVEAVRAEIGLAWTFAVVAGVLVFAGVFSLLLPGRLANVE